MGSIVKKYNNTSHRTMTLNPVDLKSSNMLTLIKKIITKILNLKLAIM